MRMLSGIIRKVVVRITPFLWLADVHWLLNNNRKITDIKEAENALGTVVLIRLDAIGDFVIWLDSAAQMRAAYAGKRIIIICNKACENIAEASGLFDEIIPVDTRRLNYAAEFSFRQKLAGRLACIDAGLLIQTSFTRRVYTDVVAAAVPAVKKVTIKDTSFDNAAKWVLRLTDNIYDEVIDTDATLAGADNGTDCRDSGGETHVSYGKHSVTMELIRNAEFTRRVTGTDFRAGIPVLKECAVRSGLIPEENYYVVFPGGSFAAKLWPVDRFAEAARYIHDKTGWTCCVCGSHDEKHLAEAFIKNYNGKVIDMTGETNIIELIEVIRHACFLIGNDTSGVHFAAATGTKALCVFGGWHYGRFLPYEVEQNDGRPLPSVCVHNMECFNCKIAGKSKSCKRHVKRSGIFECVDMVTTDQVKTALDSLIGR